MWRETESENQVDYNAGFVRLLVLTRTSLVTEDDDYEDGNNVVSTVWHGN